MANEKSALKMRIERLIEIQKLSVKRVGLAPKVLALVAMLGAAMMMPQFQFAEAVAELDSASVIVKSDDRSQAARISIMEDDHSLEIKWKGDFQLNDEETDIISVEEGTRLQITTEYGNEERRIRYWMEDGALQRDYRFNDEKHDFDDDAQVWLSETLKTLLRSSGIHAEQRVLRFLKRGGPDAVLNEMDELQGDYVARIYLGHLVQNADLDAAQLGRLVARASAFESDYELRVAINQILENENVTQDTLPLMLEAAKGVESDYELRQILTPILERMDGDDEARAMVVELLPTIESDYELRLVVEQAIASDMLTSATVTELLGMAGDHVESDYELRQIVTITADKLEGDDDAITAAVALIGEMDSDYERRIVVSEIAPHVGANEDLWLDLLKQISGIDGDYEKRVALTTVHALMPKTDALVAAYREAALTIAGDYEREQALAGSVHEASADMTTVTITSSMAVPSVPSVPSVASVPSIPSVASVAEMQLLESQRALERDEVTRYAGDERQRLEAEREALLAMQARLQARATAVEVRMKALEAAREDQEDKKD